MSGSEVAGSSVSRGRRGRIMDIVLISMIVGLLVYNVLMFRGRGGGLEPGSDAYAFSVPGVDEGVSYSLSDFSGKVVVLDFFSRQCGACKSALPGFDALSSKYSTDKVQFLVLARERNVDSGRQRLRAYWAEKGFDVPVGISGDDVFGAYRISRLPSVVVLDGAGRVSAFLGNASPREIERAIQLAVQ